jgi:tRNA nucleotidyltransferase (CCA-adding enzyme)
VRLLERLDAFRKPKRLPLILQACECDARGRGGDWPDRPYSQGPHLILALAKACQVNTAEVAQAAQARGLQGLGIAKAIHQARIKCVERGASTP